MTSPTMLRLAPAVRFEPCLAWHEDPSDEGVCAECGWSPDEHDVAA